MAPTHSTNPLTIYCKFSSFSQLLKSYFCLDFHKFLSFNKFNFFQKLPLRRDGEATAAWLAPPIKPLMRVYLFNVTNPQGFLEGEKPKLEEIGPFVYE
jgi:hypothetical protein